MEYLGRGLQSDVNRKHDWFPLEKAVEKASYETTKELLEFANAERVRSAEQGRVRMPV